MHPQTHKAIHTDRVDNHKIVRRNIGLHTCISNNDLLHIFAVVQAMLQTSETLDHVMTTCYHWPISWMSASRNVQLLETDPSPLLVPGCGTVCQHRHCSAENLKHFCLGSLIPLFCFGFTARQHSYRKSVRLSVCLSVTRWHCVKTTPATIMRSSLEDSPRL